MALEFSNYLLRDSSEDLNVCGSQWSLDDVTRTRKVGLASLGRNIDGSPASVLPPPSTNDSCVEVEDGGGVFEGVSYSARFEPLQDCGGSEDQVSMTSGVDLNNEETAGWDEELQGHARTQVGLHVVDKAGGPSQVDRLQRLLKQVHSSMSILTDPVSSSSRTDRHLGSTEIQTGSDYDGCHVAYRSQRSLPDRLSAHHVTTAVEHELRKRYSRRGSVKFADEVGLNLNTFVMIPSRHGTRARDEVTCSLMTPNRGWHFPSTADISGGNGNGFPWSFAKELGLCLPDEGPENNVPWLFRNPPYLNLIGHDNLRNLPTIPGNVRAENQRHLSNPTTITAPRAEPHSQPTEGISAPDRVSPSHKFRLCFEQPFADLDGFLDKLRTNFLCLENVRVEDRTPKGGDEESGVLADGTGGSRSGCQRGTTIICSIKARHSKDGSSVFARCTDNDWASYADLPAQHLTGAANLGSEYDTFCFAVRKPVQPPTKKNEGENPRERRSGGPTSAVEFALSCVVTTESGKLSYWDNNCSENYRIEWFD